MMPNNSFVPFVCVLLVVFIASLSVYKTQHYYNWAQKEQPLSLEVVQEKRPIPSDSELEKMDIRTLSDFFHGYIFSVQAVCNRRVRMGSIGDGGWDLCEDPRYRPVPENCLVYSFGIARDPSYDIAMQKYGCEVHAYDPSLGQFDPSVGQAFTFHKVGIAGKNSEAKGKWILHTLGKTREENGHKPWKRRVDVVKMDVEGAEIEALMTALDEGSLADVTQLAFEMHVRTRYKRPGSRDPVKEYLIKALRLLRGLWDEGFRLYHTNRNLVGKNPYQNDAEGKRQTICMELHMIRTQQNEIQSSIKKHDNDE